MLRQNGISASEQSDMLRLDAMVMMVQLNIRNLLEARSLHDSHSNHAKWIFVSQCPSIGRQACRTLGMAESCMASLQQHRHKTSGPCCKGLRCFVAMMCSLRCKDPLLQRFSAEDDAVLPI